MKQTMSNPCMITYIFANHLGNIFNPFIYMFKDATLMVSYKTNVHVYYTYVYTYVHALHEKLNPKICLTKGHVQIYFHFLNWLCT